VSGAFIENAKLNSEQLLAAKTTEGPVLILAGAGSGKTRVLTHRIAHLILDKNVSPWNILAITFTNKAAKEMKERVEGICGEDGGNVWVSTFHSACVRILHREIEALGYGKEFTIYDDDDQLKLITEIISARDLSPKEFPPKEFRFVISDAKNKLQGPNKLKELAKNEREELFADIYAEYEKRMKASNALDFDDLLIKTVVLFHKYPEILQKYANRFKYIHVDEYQDTNMVQYRLIRQLASVWNNICVVGDDDQSIYGWRGADIRNILEFEKDFENATVIKLEQNYRSTNNILESANTVIANNDGRKIKRLWSDKGNGEKIRVEELSDGRTEAYFVVSEITEKYKNGSSYNDFAVLYRTNSQSRIVEEMLLGSGIPYSVYGGQPFYGRKEVKDAIAYLRILTNPDDEIALRRIINVPKRGLGDSALKEIADVAFNTNDSMLGAVLSGDFSVFSGRIRNKLQAFSELIDDLMTNSMLMPPAEFVDYMLDKTGIKAMYEAEKTDEAKDRLNNLEELSNAAKTYYGDNPEATLQDYLVNIALVSEPEENDLFGNKRGTVTLMTLHSAKGLEFDTVFMIGMEEGIFPLSRAMDIKEELEEERRLCYVGITRAMRKLYLLHTSVRFQYGETRANPVSRFIQELPEDRCETLLPKPMQRRQEYTSSFNSWDNDFDGFFDDAPSKRNVSSINKNNSTAFAPRSNMGTLNYNKPAPSKNSGSWRVAMTVKHRRFGVGKIISVTGAGEKTMVAVAFENNGIKNLVAAQANLEIIGE
jgi:DNA helicase-2/ATP-dependent DNA helicase PcrA